MKQLDRSLLEKALLLMGEKTARAQFPPWHLVVCGGSSLIATGLIPRNTTNDLDVLARRDADGRLISAQRFPVVLTTIAREVAADLGLDSNWLNNGPADIFEKGLPRGFESRLIERAFGSHLVVSFVGRLDQIHLKVFAAANGGPPHHEADLTALEPTAEELEAAAGWALTQENKPEFVAALKQLMRGYGHEHIVERL